LRQIKDRVVRAGLGTWLRCGQGRRPANLPDRV